MSGVDGAGEIETAGIPVRELCQLLGINKATAKRRIDQGIYRAISVRANGGAQYRVEVASLPHDAQLRYVADNPSDVSPGFSEPPASMLQGRRGNIQNGHGRITVGQEPIDQLRRSPADVDDAAAPERNALNELP